MTAVDTDVLVLGEVREATDLVQDLAERHPRRPRGVRRPPAQRPPGRGAHRQPDQREPALQGPRRRPGHRHLRPVSTHHWQDWDLETLLERKQRSGLTTSLVVPARNEAATVGDVVTRVREALMETAALLDEIVVIDSDSTDATFAVATDAGAAVHRSAEIRPDLGSHRGKGEAMWKSLFVTQRRPAGVHGRRPRRLGHPLRARPARPAAGRPGGRPGEGLLRAPLRDQAGADSVLEGGRVTELVARPLIALDWPELGWLVQPLAGEWAVRRELFEAAARSDRVRRGAGCPDRHPPAARRRRDRAGRPGSPRAPAAGAARPRRHGHPDHRGLRAALPLAPVPTGSHSTSTERPRTESRPCGGRSPWSSGRPQATYRCRWQDPRHDAPSRQARASPTTGG